MSPLGQYKVGDINAHYVLDGIFNGFHVIDPILSEISYHQRNYWSCYAGDVEEKLSKLLWDETEEGNLSVVSKVPEYIHALGAVRKASGKYRQITDCSIPADTAINNHMSDVFNMFTFIRLEEVLNYVTQGMVLSVVDLQAAYRSVLIQPSNRKYFGICWHAQNGAPVILEDNFLCFYTRSAPIIFNAVSECVARLMLKKGVQCWNYLDDFMTCSRNVDQGFVDLEVLWRLLRILGSYISWPKVQGPPTCVQYLSFEIDNGTNDMHITRV